METYDPKLAARVWQRVQATGQEPDITPILLTMIAEEWQDATIYLHLSRLYPGRGGAQLRKLFEEEQAHVACLKGIYTLLTGQRASTRITPPPQGPMDTILRRCYGREMQCLAQYEQWSAHGEYGPVFSRLADQEKEHCRVLLELLGNLQKNKNP